MILVTGATGHLGAATVDFLLKTIPASQIAILARDENKAAALKAKGVAVKIGDYKNYDSLVAAFKGADKVLLISSADLDDRFKQHKNAIDAAKEAGVKHLIYTSSDIKDIANSSTGDIADVHNNTSKYLRESGLDYTLLNNNLYADVIPMFVGEKVLQTGVYFPGGEGKVPFATRNDMAEAAAHVLSNEGHENKEYVISGDVAYSFGDIAKILSEISGKEITYTSPSSEEYKQALTADGVPEFYVSMLADFAQAINDTEFDTQNSDVEKLIGRKPTLFKEYLRGVYSAQ